MDLHSAHSMLRCCILILTVGGFAQGAECQPGCHSLNGFCEIAGECRCKSGWQGELCDKCIPSPGCLHGMCTKPWECVCKEGWTGSLCNKASHNCSAEYPCTNNSTCIRNEDGDYVCSCVEEFTGKECQFRKRPCNDNGPFCQNGGSCFEDSRTAVKNYCLCLPGFTGDFCEISINNCNPNPCANHGTCADLVSSFSCLCLKEFTGKSCEYRVTPCLNHPCQNGGTCHDRPEGGFDCVCLPDYLGEICQERTFKNFKHDSKQNISKHPRAKWISHSKYFHSVLHASHKSTPQQESDLIRITRKETTHTSDSLLNSSQLICFTVLGLLTCLVILGTTGIIFFSRCEMWLANAKYRHLLWKQRRHLLQDKNEDLSVKIISSSMNKFPSYGKNYTSI
ncbi:protein delta homolog 1 isoform X1 [Hemitrygon akajei]|uniref:protein delta homolog 1 isoform X1 n=2 Tax=Hemitrygon akajei TaxID=2704970 RepID=UPI003BF9B3F3